MPTWFGVNVPKKLEKLWCGQAKCACAHASSFETTLTRLLRDEAHWASVPVETAAADSALIL
ncbi:hypothetical protein ABIA06_005542 [Bradyrhizobium yuanmingense]